MLRRALSTLTLAILTAMIGVLSFDTTPAGADWCRPQWCNRNQGVPFHRQHPMGRQYHYVPPPGGGYDGGYAPSYPHGGWDGWDYPPPPRHYRHHRGGIDAGVALGVALGFAAGSMINAAQQPPPPQDVVVVLLPTTPDKRGTLYAALNQADIPAIVASKGNDIRECLKGGDCIITADEDRAVIPLRVATGQDDASRRAYYRQLGDGRVVGLDANFTPVVTLTEQRKLMRQLGL